MASAEMTISMEAAVHKAAESLAQLVLAEYGLLLHEARWTYRDDTTIDGKAARVVSIELRTSSYRGT